MMKKIKNRILIVFLISFMFLLPHFFMEITHKDYSPFWGSANGDIIVNDETQGYGTRSKTIFRTGHFNSDTNIYENKDKKFIIELSPQVIIYAMSKVLSFDQIYYISLFFSLFVTLFCGSFFLNFIFKDYSYSLLSIFTAFFHSGIFFWIPFLSPISFIGYSTLFKFYNYSFFWGPFFLLHIFLYKGVNQKDFRFILISSFFFSWVIFSGAYRMIFSILSMGIILFYLYLSNKRLRLFLIKSGIIYGIPMAFLLIFFVINYDKTMMDIYSSRLAIIMGHFTYFNIFALKTLIILIVFVSIIYSLNKKILLKKEIHILLLLFFTAFGMANANIILGKIAEPTRIISVFLNPLLVIFLSIVIFLLLKKISMRYRKIIILAMLIFIVSINIFNYSEFIIKRSYSDIDAKNVIEYLSQTEKDSVILSLDPIMMGYITFFTDKFSYLPSSAANGCTDEEVGKRVGTAFKFYNFPIQTINYFANQRNVEDIDDDFKYFWSYIIGFSNRISRYDIDTIEAENTKKELAGINQNYRMIRYYKLRQAVYDSLMYGVNHESTGYKLDYILLGPFEGKFGANSIEGDIVFSNSQYTVYKTK